MTSRRSTNALLLIIALLLGVIAIQLGSRPFIGEAVAQASMKVTTVTGVAGCYKPSFRGGEGCGTFLPLMVDEHGRLLVSSADAKPASGGSSP